MAYQFKIYGGLVYQLSMTFSFIYFSRYICDHGDTCDLLLAMLDGTCIACIIWTMVGGTKLL